MCCLCNTFKYGCLDSYIGYFDPEKKKKCERLVEGSLGQEFVKKEYSSSVPHVKQLYVMGNGSL